MEALLEVSTSVSRKRAVGTACHRLIHGLVKVLGRVDTGEEGKGFATVSD